MGIDIANPPSVQIPDVGVRLRRNKGFWQTLRSDLQKVLSYIQQHSAQWGLAVSDNHGTVASAAEIAAARQQQQQTLRQFAGAMMFDPATAERWRHMEAAHAAQREAESLECIVLLLKRAVQVSSLLLSDFFRLASALHASPSHRLTSHHIVSHHIIWCHLHRYV